LERYGVAAPIEFDRLLHLVEGEHALVSDIQALLERKRAAPEMGLEAPVASIHAFIEAELERLDGVTSSPPNRREALPELNRVYRSSLREAWA
jgi:predicted nucleotidyltransferase